MRILFVYSGNNHATSPIIQNQKESLYKFGLEVEDFQIRGNGVLGYISNYFRLKKHIKAQHYDLVHAHYSLSGYLAWVSTRKPVIVSLMGSDTKKKRWRWLNTIFIKYFWAHTIIKSAGMIQAYSSDKVSVVPNGVNLDIFKPESKISCKKRLNFNPEKEYVLFMSDINRKEKNYALASSAISNLNNESVEFLTIYGKDRSLIPLYLNAADIIISTSLWEGSPNIIKEAMACNTAVVSTNVGDVKHLFQNTLGYYITDFSSNNVSSSIVEAISFIREDRTPTGRDRLIELKLDSDSVAKQIIDLYKKSLRIEEKITC